MARQKETRKQAKQSGALITKTHAGLLKPHCKVYFAPIRHHSPACAWAVRAMIRALKPSHVLIEAPSDFGAHIDVLLDGETKPPVAIAAIIEKDKKSRLAAYYPFCAHSPEFVALQEGRDAGAKLSFIDLPSTDKALAANPDEGRHIKLQDEALFDSNDYTNALAKRLGCRDGFELWDHLFETRLGTNDWREYFADVGAYCAALRAATPPAAIKDTGDEKREAYMAAQIRSAQQNSGGPIVVVIGGFHAPALMDHLAANKPPKAPKTAASKSTSYLIRYGFAAMDALMGYGAGLPQPGYYDYLWEKALAANGAPVWRETAQDIVAGFTKHMRAQGRAINVPAQVEMLRAAEQLAHMRGRPGALRHDLIDGARTALIKGEASRQDVWTERLLLYLRGTKLGDVPASAGLPPLVGEMRKLAASHRIDLSDGARRNRKLDIRRKSAHLAASQYFHAMDLLGTGFAEKTGGPDYLNKIRTELLFEDWGYAWSPGVEGRLIELSVYGDQLETACLGLMDARRQDLITAGEGRDLETLIDLFAKGLLAGLGGHLKPYLRTLESDIQTHADFTSAAQALQKFAMINQSAGPLGLPAGLDLSGALQGTYARLLYLCEDLHKTPEDHIDGRIKALRIMTEILRSSDAALFDRSLFDEAIDRVAAQNPPPQILGAVLAICVMSGRRQSKDLSRALSGQFSGAVLSTKARIGVLRGVLHTAPEILWYDNDVLAIIDTFLCGLNEADFLSLLPHLRLAFTKLNPRETENLSKLLSRLHGGSARSFTSASTLSEADLAAGSAIEAQLQASIKTDGLETWLLGGDGA